jgi:hypothetical protein
MDDMPRPRPPFLSRETTRHGKAIWYVRREGKRTRLRAEFGTPEFNAEYQAALSTAPKLQKGEPAASTLGWLVARYRETDAWQRLSLATRRQRENILKQVLATAGDKSIARITTETVAAGRDRRAKTPFQARHFLDTLRGLFRWAAKAKLVKADPTAGVDDPFMPKTGGHPPWTEDDVGRYERRWAIGTRRKGRSCPCRSCRFFRRRWRLGHAVISPSLPARTVNRFGKRVLAMRFRKPPGWPA